MANETARLTEDWVVRMEEKGYVTTDDAADLLEEMSDAQDALFQRENPSPLTAIIKRYHESEKNDGPNFRTMFASMLVFARQVDPELEESILNMFSHGLIAYTEGYNLKWDQANINEYTDNAFLRLQEVVHADLSGHDLDLEF